MRTRAIFVTDEEPAIKAQRQRGSKLKHRKDGFALDLKVTSPSQQSTHSEALLLTQV